MRPIEKPLVWLHGEVKSPPFSKEARLEAGYLLRRLQQGALLGRPYARPVPLIGPRCYELRIDDAGVTWRLVYRVDPDALIIAEVFCKKTARTRLSWSLGANADSGAMTMHESKRKRLEAKGWRVGTAADFLSLSTEEAAYVELKLRLADRLRKRRQQRSLTQHGLARLVGSSQSRVAKMEAGDPSVTLDLLIRALLVLGVSNRELATIIAPGRRAAAS